MLQIADFQPAMKKNLLGPDKYLSIVRPSTQITRPGRDCAMRMRWWVAGLMLCVLLAERYNTLHTGYLAGPHSLHVLTRVNN